MRAPETVQIRTFSPKHAREMPPGCGTADRRPSVDHNSKGVHLLGKITYPWTTRLALQAPLPLCPSLDGEEFSRLEVLDVFNAAGCLISGGWIRHTSLHLEPALQVHGVQADMHQGSPATVVAVGPRRTAPPPSTGSSWLAAPPTPPRVTLRGTPARAVTNPPYKCQTASHRRTCHVCFVRRYARIGEILSSR